LILNHTTENIFWPPEEKCKKGVVILKQVGLTMHCSLCRKPNHSKKGHAKQVERQQQEQRQIHGDDSDFHISRDS
jgi:hypothetical protein